MSQLTLLLTTYDDCVTRGVLYGTPNINQLKPYHLEDGGFRVIIAQDSGTLHKKEVLFDLLRRLVPPPPGDRPHQPLPLVLTLSSLHIVGELTQYMFGCFPSLETQPLTKLHILPPLLLVHGAMVLVSRIFSLDDDPVDQDDDDDWVVKPSATPILQRAYVSLRLGIGLVIPMEMASDITDVVFANWKVICDHLSSFVALVSKKALASVEPNCQRLVISSYGFQSDPDFLLATKKVVRLLTHVVNTPRVLSLPRDPSSRVVVLKLWVLEVVNWMEHKEGKPDFLVRVLTAIRHFRDENTRVVVLLNNQMVAKKLVFIINIALNGLAAPIEADTIEDAVEDDSLDMDGDARLVLSLLSLVAPCTKGWAIPALALTAATLTPIVVPHRLPQLQRLALYLSSSLALSLSSVASSWGKRGAISSSYDDYQPMPVMKRGGLFYNYKTPLPALEHDEYPWASQESLPKLFRSQSMSELVGSPTRLLEIKRTKLTVYAPSIRDETVKNVMEYNRRLIHHKCLLILRLRPKWHKQGNTLEVTGLVPHETASIAQELLPPHVAYCEEFRPEFTLQACPLLSKFEPVVVSAMKTDITRGVKTLRTIVVLLRAREVKVVEMQLGDNSWRRRNKIPDDGDIALAVAEIFAMYKRQALDHERLMQLVEGIIG